MTTTATYPRQFVDTCDCQWTKSAPEFHDRLVCLEDETTVWGRFASAQHRLSGRLRGRSARAWQ